MKPGGLDTGEPFAPVRGGSLDLFDPDALTQAVGASRLEHIQVGRGLFQGRLTSIGLGRCRIDAGRYNRTLIARGAFGPDTVVIGCILDARDPGYINGYRLARHDLVVFAEGTDLDYLVPGHTHWSAVQVPRALLELCVPHARCPASGVEVIPASCAGGAGLARLLRQILHVGAGAWQPSSGPPGAAALAGVEEVLLGELGRALECVPAWEARRPRPSYRTRMDIVRRFEQLICESWPHTPSIARLATALGLSQRTLQGVFRDHMGLSPKHYATVLQLNGAHRALLGASSDEVTVAAIARAHGVGHLGRFAAAYREQYGERPAETLRAKGR